MRWDWADFVVGLIVGGVIGFLALSIMLTVYLAGGGKVGR